MYLTAPSVFVRTVTAVTSDPVPAVVGTAMRGGSAARIGTPVPTKSLIGLFSATEAPIALAQSMGLPPPKARMASQFDAR